MTAAPARIRHRLRTIPLSVALLLAASAPAGAFDDRGAAQRALRHHIRPAYARFDITAQVFVNKTKVLCRSPSPRSLAAARDGARAALLTWGRVEHIRFGPITEEQRFDRLVFYPDPRGIVSRQIDRLLKRQDARALVPERLAGASVGIQGFTAIDRVLFAKGSAALATPSGDAFRCRYLLALADGVAQIASETLSAWAGPFGRTWLNPGSGNGAFLSAKEPTQALFRAYVTELAVVRLQRLVPMLGGAPKSGGPAPPLFPNGRLALPYLLANIEGTRALLVESGFTDPAFAGGEKERAAMQQLASVVTDLGFAQRAGEAALAASPDAFADAQARARLAPMLYSLKNAEETGRAALAALTGASLGFNSLDGD
jgi:predicted lipoprotein